MVIVQNYNRNEKKNMFLLDGLLFCYECKHKIGVRGKKNGNYYMVCNNYRRNSKLGLCTSHGFSYFNLEETIINYIKNLFQKIDSKKIELEVKKGMTKYDYGKILQKLENEIKLINNNIDKMYVDKLNNKISEEMYERVLKKFGDEIKQKEKEKYKEIEYSDKGFQNIALPKVSAKWDFFSFYNRLDEIGKKKFRFFVIFFNNQKKSGSAMCRKHMRSRSALFGFVRFLFLFYEFATAFNEFFIVVVYRAGNGVKSDLAVFYGNFY